jgi:hypothetical protein
MPLASLSLSDWPPPPLEIFREDLLQEEKKHLL